MKQYAAIGLILKNFKNQYFSVLSFSVVINLLMLAPSWYMLQVYDRVLTSHDDNTLLGLTVIIIFIYLVYAALDKYRGLVLVEVSESLDEIVAPKLHKSMLNGAAVQRQRDLNSINDLNTIKQFLTGQPILAFLDAPWVVINLIVIFMLHPHMGIMATASALILLGLAILNQRMTRDKLAAAQKCSQEERRLVSNAITASESIQVMGMRPAMHKRLSEARDHYIDNLLVASTRGVNMSSISKFFRTLIQSIILGFGAYLAIQNEISSGMIIAGSILLGRTLAPIEGVINSWKQLSEFKKAYANVDEVIRDLSETQYSVQLNRPAGKLDLRNVSLQLRKNGKPTLDKINLTVEPGETWVVIGPSGAGKTSLLKTMAGIYRPTQGQAMIDGADLAFRDHDDLGQYIGYLGQTTDLMGGKVSENIARFGEIDSAEVLKAAQLSGAHAVLLSLPEGYETVLGDQGFGLSEGQKRKIGLARALYMSPAVVFLDEPGTGLDDESMATVVQAIQTLKERKVTVVFTTHQQSLAQLADKVALVIDGQIRVQGPKQEVFAKLSRQGGAS